jgi:hypothetical protein
MANSKIVPISKNRSIDTEITFTYGKAVRQVDITNDANKNRGYISSFSKSGDAGEQLGCGALLDYAFPYVDRTALGWHLEALLFSSDIAKGGEYWQDGFQDSSNEFTININVEDKISGNSHALDGVELVIENLGNAEEWQITAMCEGVFYFRCTKSDLCEALGVISGVILKVMALL